MVDCKWRTISPPIFGAYGLIMHCLTKGEYSTGSEEATKRCVSDSESWTIMVFLGS